MTEIATVESASEAFVRDMTAMVNAIVAETSKSERARLEAKLAEYLWARDRGESPIAFTTTEGDE